MRAEFLVKKEYVRSEAHKYNDQPKRRDKLLNLLHSFNTPDDINKSSLADQLGVTRQTIGNDLKALESTGVISLNGVVKVNQE